MQSPNNQTRQQIIDSARSAFERYGYKKTTIEDIAKAMGLGKSAVYYYFINKEDIFKAVLDNEADELKEKLIKAVDLEPTAKDKIKTHLEVRVEAVKQLGNLYNFEKRDFLSGNNVKELRQKYDQIEIDLIAKILNRGVQQGEFVINDVNLAAMAIVTLIKGLEIQIIHHDSETSKRYIEAFLPLLFNGIASR